ncbi:MAG: hypothetical protein E7412_01820 [Ruminococcaceae bacterium]|nr:hypothetical protein [Oscillospiraceae bacterium]
MDKIISYENLKRFAYTNEKICKKPIKGVVISFFGCGATFASVNDESSMGKRLAEMGILYITPHNNPWSFMNKQAFNCTEEIMDVLFEHYNLGDDIPIVYSGGSMGGQSALMYSVLSKRKPVACVVNCPACDVVDKYKNDENFSRILYSAVYHEDGPIEEALEKISPNYNVDKLPKIKYYVFHCDKDDLLDIKTNSDVLVAKMKDDFDITYHIVHGTGHAVLTPEMQELYDKYIIDSILN